MPRELDLADAAYFALDDFTDLEVRLLESDFVGIALRAPARIDTSRHAVLPLLVASRFDGAREWSLPFADKGLLVGIDLRSRAVHVAPALASAKRAMEVEPAPRPAPQELQSFGAQVLQIDARARLDLPWHQGSWAFVLLYHDWPSNRVVVNLEEPGATREPAAPPDAATPEVSFRLLRDPGDPLRLEAQYSLTPSGQELPVTLLILSHGTREPRRFDWTVALDRGERESRMSGELTRELPPDFAFEERALAYLVLGGGVFGPWPSAGPSSRAAK